MLGYERAWPLCPRPFVDETFGSWFGRVAACYRLDVDELALAADIKLELDPNLPGWLTTAPAQGNALLRIAALARMSPQTLLGLASDTRLSAAHTSLWFCCRCLFVNPIEVESPYWRSAWLLDGPGECAIHRVAREQLSTTALNDARNMESLLSHISLHRTTLFEWESCSPFDRLPQRRRRC